MKFECIRCHKKVTFTPDPMMPGDSPLICVECWDELRMDKVKVEDDEEDDLG